MQPLIKSPQWPLAQNSALGWQKRMRITQKCIEWLMPFGRRRLWVINKKGGERSQFEGCTPRLSWTICRLTSIWPFEINCIGVFYDVGRFQKCILEPCTLTSKFYSTVRVDSLPHRKWKETKQEPGTTGPGNMLGCCLVSFHFLWGKLSTRTVK